MTTQLEHAELLRVAELAAGGAEPNAVFAAVVAAASTVLGGRQARVIRLTDDGPSPVPGGGRLTTTRTPFDAALAQVTAEVRRRGHAARLDVEGAGKVAESAEAVGVPIGVDSRLWGVLAAGPAGTPLPPDAERLLAPLAAICAAVVAGTLARDGLRALAEEQTALLRVAELVAKGANPTELFDAVAREASRLIADEPTTLGRFEGPRTYTVVAGYRSPAPIGTRIQVAPDDEGLVAEMLQTRSPARLDDHRTRRGPSYARDDFGVLSSVGAPILVDDGIWGFVCGTSDGRRFPADAEQRLQRFAGLITSALANAQARVQLQELADEQAALRRVAELVARAAPPTEVFTAVATEASGLLDGQAMTLTRFGGDAELVVVAVHGGPAPVGQRIAFEPDTLPDRIRRGAGVVRVDDYTRERDAELATTFNLAAAVSAPIVVEGTVWGMLTATSDQQPLQPGTEGRLEQFAQLVAAALANSQARSELQAMADEQAALHRVAELVARGAAPEEVFVAVTNEASALLGDLAAALMLYDDAGAVVVASCNCPAPVGLHVPFSAGTAVDQLFRTGRPAQVATYEGTVLADVTRELGIASTTAVPITVEGRVRAALVSSSTGPPIPAGVEARLTPFAHPGRASSPPPTRPVDACNATSTTARSNDWCTPSSRSSSPARPRPRETRPPT